MRQIAKLIAVLCLVIFAPAAVQPFQQPAPKEQAQNKTETVYVTRTDTRYHRDGCRYLLSRIPISLKDAQVKGYTPCKVCHPPQ